MTESLVEVPEVPHVATTVASPRLHVLGEISSHNISVACVPGCATDWELVGEILSGAVQVEGTLEGSVSSVSPAGSASTLVPDSTSHPTVVSVVSGEGDS